MDTQTLAPRSGRKVELKLVVILVAHCCPLCLSHTLCQTLRTCDKQQLITYIIMSADYDNRHTYSARI